MLEQARRRCNAEGTEEETGSLESDEPHGALDVGLRVPSRGNRAVASLADGGVNGTADIPLGRLAGGEARVQLAVATADEGRNLSSE